MNNDIEHIVKEVALKVADARKNKIHKNEVHMLQFAPHKLIYYPDPIIYTLIFRRFIIQKNKQALL